MNPPGERLGVPPGDLAVPTVVDLSALSADAGGRHGLGDRGREPDLRRRPSGTSTSTGNAPSMRL